MNITSQYFLAYYAGNQELDLISPPASITSDNRLYAEYNRFIDGISTIYASQDSTGSIPVFWTVPSNYGYAASSQSTLKKLQPKQSYYFIVRDESYLPLHIPQVGGTIQGLTDLNKLPYIEPVPNITLDKSNGNYAYLQFNISGLQPYEQYSYKFNNISSNWPTIIHPLSGTIKPSDTIASISAVANLCKTSGDCSSDSNLLNYTIDSHGVNLDNLYSIFNLEIQPISFSGLSVNSNSVRLQCKSCLPQLLVSIPSVGILSSTNATIPASNDPIPVISGDNRFFTFKASIAGLEPNQSYNYVYRSIDGNWPAAIMTPISGTIKPNSNSLDLQTTISFCANTGVCPSSVKGLLNFSLAPKADRSNLFTVIDLSVTKVNGSNSTISNPLTVYCQECV
jgi:hypothetical protein